MLAEDKAGLFLKRMNDQHLNILISGAGLGLNQYFLDTATTHLPPPREAICSWFKLTRTAWGDPLTRPALPYAPLAAYGRKVAAESQLLPFTDSHLRCTSPAAGFGVIIREIN